MIDFTAPPVDDRFVACLPFTLAQECPHPDNWPDPRNFSNDAHDPGGKTMCGIIQREYDAWRTAQSLPTRDVRLLTEAEGREIYETSYWRPYCDRLPPGLDLAFFDAGVNEGVTEAVKILQAALGAGIDGEWGDLTTAALAGATAAPGGEAALINAFTARRKAVYREMRGFQYFGDDWLRRAAEIGAQALKMAA
jgi:lysozyme family protein